MVGLGVLTGCHRVSGHADDRWAAGDVRHLASLDILHRSMVVFCVLAVAGGAAVVVYSIDHPEMYDGHQARWVLALMVIAAVFAVRTWLDFRYLRYCC
jgi:hypothetical protein